MMNEWARLYTQKGHTLYLSENHTTVAEIAEILISTLLEQGKPLRNLHSECPNVQQVCHSTVRLTSRKLLEHAAILTQIYCVVMPAERLKLAVTLRSTGQSRLVRCKEAFSPSHCGVYL